MALLLALLAPPDAHACAVCQDPGDVRAAAYFDMTMFLSLVPLGTIGIGVAWVWRRSALAR